jgi:hypothetical protein
LVNFFCWQWQPSPAAAAVILPLPTSVIDAMHTKWPVHSSICHDVSVATAASDWEIPHEAVLLLYNTLSTPLRNVANSWSAVLPVVQFTQSGSALVHSMAYYPQSHNVQLTVFSVTAKVIPPYQEGGKGRGGDIRIKRATRSIIQRATRSIIQRATRPIIQRATRPIIQRATRSKSSLAHPYLPSER